MAELSEIARAQGGVASRIQLYALGVTRATVRANVCARRWWRVGSQSVALQTGPLTREGELWAAVFVGGPCAMLNRSAALVAGGLEQFRLDRIRVSVPRGGAGTPGEGAGHPADTRWQREDVMPSGVPRTRPEVAAVRAALWARSNRQAALLLTMTVQQGLATAEQVGGAMLRIRRDRRRLFVHGVILDLVGGVRSLGELDVVLGCRARGIPAPSRQVVRRPGNGTYYLDLVWDRWGVVVEVDGIQHPWATQVGGDALRQNAVTLSYATVLRLPLMGLRVAPEDPSPR